MSLSGVIRQDVLSDLFFRDFGEDMVIDGVPLDVDVRDEGTGQNDRREGVSIHVRTLYWRTADLAEPKPRQEMIVDGEKWEVSKVEDKSGMVQVQMFRELS